jgi:hypothetical protein
MTAPDAGECRIAGPFQKHEKQLFGDGIDNF